MLSTVLTASTKANDRYFYASLWIFFSNWLFLSTCLISDMIPTVVISHSIAIMAGSIKGTTWSSAKWCFLFLLFQRDFSRSTSNSTNSFFKSMILCRVSLQYWTPLLVQVCVALFFPLLGLVLVNLVLAVQWSGSLCFSIQTLRLFTKRMMANASSESVQHFVFKRIFLTLWCCGLIFLCTICWLLGSYPASCSHPQCISSSASKTPCRLAGSSLFLVWWIYPSQGSQHAGPHLKTQTIKFIHAINDW